MTDQVCSTDTAVVAGDPMDFLNRDELAEVELVLAHYLGVPGTRPPR